MSDMWSFIHKISFFIQFIIISLGQGEIQPTHLKFY